MAYKENYTYAGIPLGFAIRKQIGKAYIYRVRRGNGYYDSVAGKLYQDKMIYFVPSSINNAEGEPSRIVFAAAVLNWKTVLTEEQKTEYNKRASKGMHMSGYNLYIREHMRANI